MRHTTDDERTVLFLAPALLAGTTLFVAFMQSRILWEMHAGWIFPLILLGFAGVIALLSVYVADFARRATVRRPLALLAALPLVAILVLAAILAVTIVRM